MSSGDYTAPPRAETLTFDCQMRGPDLVGLSFKNALLNVVTLSIYRFWAKTEVRRRIWSAVTLNGEAFEYTGRGMELFKGFLIAAALVGLPLVIALFVAQLVEPVGALLLILVYLVGFSLIGVATFTAFRYQASRTAWRGVRFELSGSPISYGLLYIGMMVLSVVTLGWYWPSAQRRLAAPLWGGLSFGDRKLSFDIDAARKVGVYKAFAFGWATAAVAYLLIGLVALAGAVAEEVGESGSVGAAALLGAFAVVLAMSHFQAAMLRSIAAGIHLDGVRFDLDVRWGDLLSLTLTNMLLAVLSFGILLPVTRLRTIRLVAQRLRAQGLVDLSTVRQTERGPKTGEGLADIFDLATV